MPTYDIHCGACNREFEVFHGINEPDPKRCPKCGKTGKLRRMFTKAPAYHSHYSPMHPRVNRGRGY